jgi:putative transposase
LIRYRQSQKIEGIPKSITITYKAGHWYASILCEIPRPKPVVTSETALGIDLGVKNFATSFDGSLHEFHQFPDLSKKLIKLKRYQRTMARKVFKSNNWKKAKAKVIKQYDRIESTAKDFRHKLSTRFSKENLVNVLETLNIKGMSKSAKGTLENPGKKVAQKRGLNRAIQQQGWRSFIDMLLYKGNWYGSTIVHVDARNTSRTCPRCNHIHKDNRKSQAKFHCLFCNYQNHADVVGAINIRNLAVPIPYMAY